MQIGLGLFARTSFREGEKIVFFVGELFHHLDEFDGERAGHKPYILHSKKADEYGIGEWLDCFETRAQNQCVASVSNSPYACFNVATQKNGYCELYFEGLQAITTINAHNEILWSYGADYEYPDRYTHDV